MKYEELLEQFYESNLDKIKELLVEGANPNLCTDSGLKYYYCI